MQAVLIDDYNYALAEEQIAKFPLELRDSSKLLHYNKGEISHKKFTNLADSLPANSHLVFNNTKVLPARILLESDSGAHIEVLLLNPIFKFQSLEQALAATSHTTWQCIIGNKKRWKSGKTLSIAVGNTMLKLDYFDYENNQVRFTWDPSLGISFNELINDIGKLPLPPYLNRENVEADKQNYQTIYSEKLGAVAAPTAGLHFTERVFESLYKAGHSTQNITLHVGAGTFLPVKVANVLEHNMHNEQIIFSHEGIKNLLLHINNIIAVGTTSMRALESLYWIGHKIIHNEAALDGYFLVEKLYPYQQAMEVPVTEALEAIIAFMEKQAVDHIVAYTEILISPGYQFKLCKGLITNFHQPKSTLLVLIAALIGKDWKRVYDSALANDYRFLSYGDSSLLLPNQ